MSFVEKFASFLRKNALYLLIIYVVIGAVLLPVSTTITEKMTMSERAYLPENVESLKAEDIINESFEVSMSGDVILVVHSKSGTVLNQKTYMLIRDLEDWMINDWTVDGESIVDSIYSFYDMDEWLVQLTAIFYQYPMLATDLVWYPADLFGGAWEYNYTANGSIPLADAYAIGKLCSSISDIVSAISGKYALLLFSPMGEDIKSMLYDIVGGYVSMFNVTWSSMRMDALGNMSLPPNTPVDVGVTVVVRAVVENMVSMGLIDPSIALLLNASAYALNYSTWDDINYLAGFIMGYHSEVYGVSVDDPAFEIGFIENVYNGSIMLKVQKYVVDSFDGKTPALFPKNIMEEMKGYFVSDDGDTTIIMVDVASRVEKWKESQIEPYISKLRERIDEICGEDIEILVTGTLAFRVDNLRSAEEDIRMIDTITFVLVLVLLLLIYRGIPVSLMPLILMGLVVIIARVLLIGLATVTGLYISDVTIALMTTVIIGAGVDYTIFLISRYAEDRRRGKSKDDAIVSVIKHAGKSVSLSGGTVMIAFGALVLSSFKFIQDVGLGIMLGVGVTLLVSLTLTPCILYIFGDKIFWPSKLVADESGEDSGGEAKPTYREGRYEQALRRISKATIKHAKVVVILAVVVTLPALYIYFHYGTTYDFIKLTRKDTESRDGFELLVDEVGVEKFATTEVVGVYRNVNFLTSNGELNWTLVTKYIKPVVEVLRGVEGVKCVRSPYTPYGEEVSLPRGPPSPEDILNTYTATSYVSKNGSIVRFSVDIGYSPYSEDAFRTVDKIREKLAEWVEDKGVDAKFYVGGLTASYRDISYMVNEDFKIIITIVIIGIIILLFIALRSVLIPIRLEITILLSIIWAISISMLFWFFVESLQLIWFIPLFMFAVLNGLGMDYDIFLVTRIEEERFEKGLSDEEAIVEAVASTGKIISIAGIIMATAFGSLVLTLSPPTRQIGMTLALGILIDAFIIRIILVPAIMVIAGKWNWWPRKIK